MTIGVYGIYNVVSDKWYVGQSVNIEKRWGEHRCKLNSAVTRPANRHFQGAWDKYGEKSFECFVLEEVSDASLLTIREEFWIQNKRATSGGVYNQRVAADSNLGWHQSLETRKKLSIAGKGKKRSTETKSKISSSMKGIKKSSETRINMSIAQQGRETLISPETRLKMSVSHLGKKLSPAHRAKLALVWTADRREKFAESQIGKKHSLETRVKMSTSHKGIFLGSANPMAKLTEAEVTIIKGLLLEGVDSVCIADVYGVSLTTIRDIKKGRTWKHVEVTNG